MNGMASFNTSLRFVTQTNKKSCEASWVSLASALKFTRPEPDSGNPVLNTALCDEV